MNNFAESIKVAPRNVPKGLWTKVGTKFPKQILKNGFGGVPTLDFYSFLALVG